MSQTKAHFLEGRKREEQVGELRNVACHKQGLMNWRGGRERSRLVSLEMWHVTNEDSHPGHKSYLFRNNVCPACMQRLKTCAWAEVHAIETTVQHHANASSIS